MVDYDELIRVYELFRKPRMPEILLKRENWKLLLGYPRILRLALYTHLVLIARTSSHYASRYREDA